MANETKIGLVVGLAFIVCFAIVLSNRGATLGPAVMGERALAQEVVKSPSETVVSTEERARDAARRPGGRRSLASAHHEGGKAAADDPVGRRGRKLSPPPPAEPEAEVPPGSAFERSEGHLPADSNVETESEVLADATPHDTPDVTVADQDTHAGVDLPVQDPSSTETELDRKLAELGGRRREAMGLEPSATRESETESSASGDDGMTRHTVKKGETLYRIALTHYGSATQEIVDAIYKANRATLKAPNQLQVDESLLIPVLASKREVVEPLSQAETVSAKTGPPSSDTKKRGTEPESAKKKPAEPKDRKWTWYQVRSGDKYTTIADKHLGSSSRWKQLFDLNKDIFPDAAKIRPGVLIRVPTKTTEAER